MALLADDPLGKTREDCTSPLDPGYTAAWAAIDADPNQLLIVADIENAVVGCLQLSFIPGLSHKGALRGQIESRPRRAHLSKPEDRATHARLGN